MKKIKVLIVAADPAAGMVPFVVTIANTLAADERFDIYAIVTDSEKLSYTKNLNDNINIQSIKYPTSALKKFIFKLYAKNLFKILNNSIKRIRPDVIHFMVGDFIFASYNIKRSDLYDKICVTIHDLHPHEIKRYSFNEWIIDKIIILGRRKVISNTKYLTTSSLSQFYELKKIYPSNNVCFTHFPSLVTSAIEHGTKVVKELVNVNKYILFFGAVVKYKGVDLLISAFSSIQNTNGVKLVIAGKGDGYESDNPNIIRLNRFIEDEEIADLFKNALFVVYPYISATMSGVLSLAYYFHKRVLLSDIPFFKDNETPSCTFFHNGNADDLKEKIELLFEQDFDLFTNDYYSSIYSDKVLTDDYFALYNKIMNGD